MSRHRLCTTFIGLAEWTRNALRKGYQAGINIGEESLTDFALVRVANRNPQHVRTRKFTRAQEGISTGADWLWLFGSENDGWLPLLVQAKVMHPNVSPRKLLTYRNGEQNRLLLEFALENNLYPAYCVYNPVPIEFSRSLDLSCGLGPEQYACALLTLNRRQQLIGTRPVRQSDLLSSALPLASLVCCTPRDSDELAQNVADVLELALDNEPKRQVLRSSELEQAVLNMGPRDTLIEGREVEQFIARIQELSIHSATGRPLLAGIVQFSSIPFDRRG